MDDYVNDSIMTSIETGNSKVFKKKVRIYKHIKDVSKACPFLPAHLRIAKAIKANQPNSSLV